MDPILSRLDYKDLKPICWAEIRAHVKYEDRCRFIDGSKGKFDPRFCYLVIAPDRIEGYDEHLIVCYFDKDGEWITQSFFESLKEAIDHCRWLFETADEDWRWSDANLPDRLGI